MLAHYHGQVWNASEFGRSFGVADTTVCGYLDLLCIRGKTRLGFEFKRTSSPRVTPSMRSALKDLGLKRLFVVFPGGDSYDLGKNIRAVGLDSISTGLP